MEFFVQRIKNPLKEIRVKLFFWIFVFFCLLATDDLAMAGAVSAGISSVPERKLKADVVLLAVPITVKSPTTGRTIDALEKPSAEMGKTWKIVVFNIERVITGNFKILPIKDPSLWSQVKDAADDKNILKLLMMDFQRPEEDSKEKNALSMAVTDPLFSFGIKENSPSPKQRYKISLALVQKTPESYVMVKSEKA
jgi:hypothetical protein